MIVVDSVSIRGKSMHVAVWRVRSSFEYRDNLRVTYPTTKYNPLVYVVRGTSVSSWESLWSNQIAVLVCSILVQVATSVTISFVLYRPVAQLVASLRHKGVMKSTGAKVKLATSIGSNLKQENEMNPRSDARTSRIPTEKSDPSVDS